ncbi:autophagy-related protein 101-like, partial [Elysia marginata]
MNARSQVIELVVEGKQIEDVVQALFHTILLHRSTGKYKYSHETKFTIGSVAVQDMECDFVDFIYVKLKSPELETYLRREVALFRDMLRSSEGQNSGQITLEFYRKNKGRWLFPGENSPWEVWTIKLDVVNLQSEN